MPTWSNTPPPLDASTGFTLLRTPPDRPLVAVVTTDDLIGCQTHYWGGRTVPCEATPDPKTGQLDTSPCPACLNLQPRRWHAYVAAFDPKTRTHFLFETTARAALAFQDYRLAHGTTRGCYFQAVRPRPGKNTRIEITTKPFDQQKCPLPNPPNLIRALSVIWQLPATALHTPADESSAKTITTCRATVRRMRGELPDETTPDEPTPIAEIITPQLTNQNANHQPKRQQPTKTQ
jgi:hypothetical protein